MLPLARVARKESNHRTFDSPTTRADLDRLPILGSVQSLVLPQQPGKALGILHPHHPVLADEHLRIQGLVEQSPDLIGRSLVGLVQAVNPGHGPGDDHLDVVKLGSELAEPVLSRCQSPADPVLFALEQVEGDGTGVVAVEQLLPFLLEPLNPTLLDPAVRLGLGSFVGQILGQHLPNQVLPPRRQPHRPPVPFQGLLDGFGLQGFLIAANPPLPAKADEVAVPSAVAAGKVQGQAAVADRAEDAAFQVVLVAPAALPGGVVGEQHGLHLEEHFRCDECRMGALVLDATELDNAHVVGLDQDALQCRDMQGFGRLLGRGPGGEPTGGQLGEERVQ